MALQSTLTTYAGRQVPVGVGVVPLLLILLWRTARGFRWSLVLLSTFGTDGGAGGGVPLGMCMVALLFRQFWVNAGGSR
jgi:hypothetical protein